MPPPLREEHGLTSSWLYSRNVGELTLLFRLRRISAALGCVCVCVCVLHQMEKLKIRFLFIWSMTEVRESHDF